MACCIEPYAVSDTFISGMCDVAFIEDNMIRITCFTWQTDPLNPTRMEKVVVAKLVMSRRTMGECHRKVRAKIEEQMALAS